MKLYTSETVSKIRKAFYDVIVELFAKYKEFAYKDPFGEIQYDVKKFILGSNKKYK